MIEHVWCSFCEDRPAMGRMVVMEDRSSVQISEISGKNGAACDLHGRAWTGVPISAGDVTGLFAVLQYIHPDYEQVTVEHISEFASEKVCCKCGDPTEPLPVWAVERILKAYPYLVLSDDLGWEGICQQCALDSGCPHCVDDDNDDHSACHPYCH